MFRLQRISFTNTMPMMSTGSFWIRSQSPAGREFVNGTFRLVDRGQMGLTVSIYYPEGGL